MQGPGECTVFCRILVKHCSRYIDKHVLFSAANFQQSLYLDGKRLHVLEILISTDYEPPKKHGSLHGESLSYQLKMVILSGDSFK